MLNRFEDELEIFDNFVVDKKLPKHQVKEKVNVSGFDNLTMGVTGGISFGGSDSSNDQSEEKKKELNKVWDNFLRYIGVRKREITVQQFFKHIKNTADELETIEKRSEGYEEVLRCAIDAGQTSLIETIKDNMSIVKSESQLIAKGLRTVITEDQIIEFYKESEKGIRLDWVKNFSRVIPCEIIDTKRTLDELEVFDNYVVMHYDPNKKSYKMTKAEKEKRKDPILFGVIKNSRKLYFVGDWEDDVCDLTLDKLVSKFGKDAVTQNDISVNISIDNYGNFK